MIEDNDSNSNGSDDCACVVRRYYKHTNNGYKLTSVTKKPFAKESLFYRNIIT